MTLGEPRRKQPGAGTVVGVSLVLGLAAGAVWWAKRHDLELIPRGRAATPPVATAPAEPLAAVAPPVAAAPVASSAAQLRSQAGMRYVGLEVDGPLETSLRSKIGDAGSALAQVITRTLVWWVDVPQDLRKGDHLDVLYTERPGEEPLVEAVRFTSGKNAQTYATYRFQSPSDPYPRYFLPDGGELELRLENAPVDTYEQVTSLIRDGRGHKGVDFRTPVGTPVKAPFSGVVTRKNWNWRSNGNCLEVTEAGGAKKALFLHLEQFPRPISVGERISRGEVIGQTGNTGHSFAPHLHFQLMRGEDKVLDPFAIFKTYRRHLPDSAVGALKAEIARLDGLMQP